VAWPAAVQDAHVATCAMRLGSSLPLATEEDHGGRVWNWRVGCGTACPGARTHTAVLRVFAPSGRCTFAHPMHVTALCKHLPQVHSAPPIVTEGRGTFPMSLCSRISGRFLRCGGSEASATSRQMAATRHLLEHLRNYFFAA
jgi:hypothetical protein